MKRRQVTHVAIKEDDDVTSCCISSSLLGSNEADRLLVAFDHNLVFLPHLFVQMRCRKWWIASQIAGWLSAGPIWCF